MLKPATTGAGIHKKKVGAKKKAGGKQRVADRDKACEARKAAAWAKKVPTIIPTLKTERGESLTASSSRMVLIVTMNIVNDRGIIIEKGKRDIKGIDGAFAGAARITSVCRETTRAVFYSWVGLDYETFNVGGRVQQQQGRSRALEGRAGPRHGGLAEGQQAGSAGLQGGENVSR
jgi:hypothetical protein